jgi:mRNA interferase HigB
VHIISRKRLEATEDHGDLGVPLDVWYPLTKSTTWKNLIEVRQLFPTADPVEEFTVFNIKGNA